MKPLHVAILLTAVGLVGVAVGYTTAGKGVQKINVSNGRPDAPARKGSPVSSGSGAKPIFVDLPPQQFFDRALAIIVHGGKTESLAALEELLVSRSLPPAAADVYRNALIARLVHLGAANELLEHGQFPTKDRQAIVTEVVRSLAGEDLDAAITATKGLPATERSGATAALMEVMGRKDPKQGLALLKADPKMRSGQANLFFGWAKVDPQAAAKEAFAAHGNEYQLAQLNVMASWAYEDPEVALAWVDSQPAAQRSNAARGLFSALAWSDPERALDALATRPELGDSSEAQLVGMAIADSVKEANAAVNKLPPGTARTQLIDGLARSLSGNPAEAIAWVKTLLPGEQDSALEGMFMGMGFWDPATALDVAKRGLTGAQRQKAIGAIITGWAEKDFDAAFETVSKKLDPDELRAALPTLFRYHSSRGEADEARQFATIAKLTPDVRRDVLLAKGEAAATRADGDFGQLANLTPEDRAAFAEGAMERSFEIPDNTARQLIEMLPPEKQVKFARQISEVMARSDSSRAAEFVAQLPENGKSSEKGAAFDRVMSDWVAAEPAVAMAFVERLPAGGTKDVATQSLVKQLRTFDLEAATRVASGAASQQIRNKVIKQLAGDWARVDAARGRVAMAPLFRTEEDRKLAAALFGEQR